MRHGHHRAGLGRRTVLGAVATGLAGCAFGERGAPVPDADVRAATVLGLPNERFCAADPVDLPRIVEEFNQAGRRQRRQFGLGPRDPLPPSSIIAFRAAARTGPSGRASPAAGPRPARGRASTSSPASRPAR